MITTCPICEKNETQIVGDHFFCNNCFAEFTIKIDTKKHFPYNVIFPKRSLSEFYRKPLYHIE